MTSIAFRALLGPLEPLMAYQTLLTILI